MPRLLLHGASAASLADDLALGAPASASAASARNSNAAGLEKKVRVLVVDDDLGQRTVLKSLLQKFGYQVDTAEDGVQAVKSAARVAYDVILMDGFMPNKTGWEATTEIRQQEEERGDRKRLIIIGVTGATSKEDEAKCFASGMTDVISKPVKRDSLHAKIEKWTSAAVAPKDEDALAVLPRIVRKEVSAANKTALILSKDKALLVMLKNVLKSTGIACVFCDSQVSRVCVRACACIHIHACMHVPSTDPLNSKPEILNPTLGILTQGTNPKPKP